MLKRAKLSRLYCRHSAEGRTGQWSSQVQDHLKESIEFMAMRGRNVQDNYGPQKIKT